VLRLLLLTLSVLRAGADTVEPEACQGCHAAQVRTQTRSRHFAALRPILQTPLPRLLADAPIRERSGIAFDYRPGPAGLLATVSRGGRQLEANLAWAFGAGAQAYTPVGMRGGRYFEHRVSYYTAAERPGRTLGHPGDASRSLDAALGLPQDADTIYRCFNCHATGVRPGPELSAMRPGVTCERCHGESAAHTAGARSTGRLSGLSPAGSVRFCGQCHRSPGAPDSSAKEEDDPFAIRFQPIGLMASRCFRESGKLSCITCHNPHEDAQRDAGYYVAKCLGCHPAAGGVPPACGRAEGRNCLPCHMPRRSPAEFLTFTDHRVRIYR
jgi:hypothetical protein